MTFRGAADLGIRVIAHGGGSRAEEVLTLKRLCQSCAGRLALLCRLHKAFDLVNLPLVVSHCGLMLSKRRLVLLWRDLAQLDGFRGEKRELGIVQIRFDGAAREGFSTRSLVLQRKKVRAEFPLFFSVITVSRIFFLVVVPV